MASLWAGNSPSAEPLPAELRLTVQSCAKPCEMYDQLCCDGTDICLALTHQPAICGTCRSIIIAGRDHNIALCRLLLRQIILELVRMELLHLARDGILPAQTHTACSAVDAQTSLPG